MKSKCNYVIFLLTMTFFVFANKAEACTVLSDLKWPDELINFYFSQNGSKIIPLPSSICAITKDFKVLNLEGKEFGVLKFKMSKFYYYNDITIKSNEPNNLIRTFHETVKKITNPYLLTDFIFGIYNSKLLNEKDKKIQFIVGELINSKVKTLWNPNLFPKNHWNAKVIDYKQLIQFYAKSNVEFYTFSDQDGYFFPKAIIANDILPKDTKFNLLDLLFDTNLKTPLNNNDIVVFSTYKNTFKGYNLISKLYTKNAKNVYWFKDADKKWVNNKEKTMAEVFKRTKIASQEQLLTSLKSNDKFKIIDVSDPDAFETIHFKNSIPLYPEKLSVEGFKQYYLRTYTQESYNRLVKENKVTGNYMLTGLDKISKDDKLYLVGHHMLDPNKSINVYKTLVRFGFSNVLLVPESISDLILTLNKSNIDPDKYIFQKQVFSAKSIGSFF